MSNQENIQQVADESYQVWRRKIAHNEIEKDARLTCIHRSVALNYINSIL